MATAAAHAGATLKSVAGKSTVQVLYDWIDWLGCVLGLEAACGDSCWLPLSVADAAARRLL